MATEAAVAKRRAEAETRIQTALSALGSMAGVELEQTAYPVRDLELRRVIGLEQAANGIEQILAAFVAKETERSKNEEAENAETNEETDEEALTDLPEDFPHRAILISQNVTTLARVKELGTRLVELNDIGQARAKEILAVVK